MTETFDLRTSTEKGEDAFADYLKSGQVGSMARVSIDGSRLKLKMTQKSEEGIVSFDVLGRGEKVKDKFAFNTKALSLGGLELVKIL